MAEAKKNAGTVQTVFIPKTGKHDDALYVAVNGQRILVKKGEPVALPEKFAEVIRHSEEAAQTAEDYIESVSAAG